MTDAPHTPEDLWPDDDWTGIALERAWTRALPPSRAGAPERRLWLGLPEDAAPPSGWPLVLVLDGGDFFHAMLDTARRLARRPAATGVAPAIVAAIDTMETGPARTARRRADHVWTPPADPDEAPPGAPGPAGADYLDLILTRILPALRAEFPIDATAQSLFGHSLAGNFALHALAARPDGFRVFGAVSPSLWWSRDETFAQLDTADFAAARLLLAVGEREEGPAARAHAGPRRMVGNVRDLAARLAPRFRDGDFRFALFPDEDHASVVNIAMTRFLRMAAPPEAPA